MKTLKKFVFGSGMILASGLCANAQITNTVSGVGSTITGGISTVYDTAVTVGIVSVAIGMAVHYVRRGLKTRA